MKKVGCTWKKLKQSILEHHTVIAHRFFTGSDLKLMALESQIAKEVLLSLSANNVVYMLVHDSFIVHQGNKSLLRECMRKSFLQKFGVDPGMSSDYGSVSKSEPLSSAASIDEKIAEMVSSLSLPQERRLGAF